MFIPTEWQKAEVGALFTTNTMNSTSLRTLTNYLDQLKILPGKENTLQAQSIDNHVVVYQACNAKIASWAVKEQCFGGPDFSLNRVSWIKPNFTWMMYRCGWAEKDPSQE
jgi:hypothetical protein